MPAKIGNVRNMTQAVPHIWKNNPRTRYINVIIMPNGKPRSETRFFAFSAGTYEKLIISSLIFIPFFVFKRSLKEIWYNSDNDIRLSTSGEDVPCSQSDTIFSVRPSFVASSSGDRPFCFRRFVNLSTISRFTALPLPLNTHKYRCSAPFRQICLHYCQKALR